MLRSQVKRQGSFYVCASCRRQHQQNLAQLRTTSSTPASALPSTSRLLSSSAQPAPMRPGSGTYRHDALHPDHDGHAPQSATPPRVDVRGYSSYGKFGSGLLPGQSNADWAKAGSATPGAAGPKSWGGGMGSGKIQPAQGTSAWGSRAGGGGIQPAKATSINAPMPPPPPGLIGTEDKIAQARPTTTTGDSNKQASATPAQPAAPEGIPIPPWVGRADTLMPAQSASTPRTSPGQSTAKPAQAYVPVAPRPQSQGPPADGAVPGRITTTPAQPEVPKASSPQAQSAPVADAVLGKSTAPAQPDVPKASGLQSQGSSVADAVLGKSTTTPAKPVVPGTVSPLSQSSPVADAVPGKSTAMPTPKLSLGTGAAPLRRPSGMPKFTATNTLGQNSVFDGGLLPHEKLAIQGAQKPKPPPPPPASPSSQGRSPTQNSGLDDQDFSRYAPLRRTNSNPPPLPPGAEFPQLRRKSPNVDDFEALSPFNLPPKGAPRQEEAAPRSAEPAPGAEFARPMRKPPSGLRRSERYPNWRGSPSSLGAVAPDPVDNFRDSNMGKLRDFGDSLSGPDKTASSTPRQVDSSPTGWATTRNVSERTSQSSSSRTSDIRTPLESSKPGDAFSTLQQAAATQAVDAAPTTVAESDWGLTASDLLTPEERHAQRRREEDRKHSVLRELAWEERPRDRDRGTGSSGRGRGPVPVPGKSKKRSGNRRHDDEDDVDSGFDYEAYRMRKEETRRRKEEKRAAKEALTPKTILLPEYITVSDLAGALGVRPNQFLLDLGELGFENILQDSIMTGETAALVASEYGFDPTVDTGNERDLKPAPAPEDPSVLPPRPPIVTIMGHVDHGKTTMLDWLRKSSVAAQEHGGITQHIGAFSVRLRSGKMITFLDTPGHAAFLSMRQRGANVTDVVVLVVAVDDSVKPQTLEALKHAKNSKVPIIVAINKIDKDPSGIDKVKQDLGANGVDIEDFGGDVQVVAVSGKTGQGMDDLEESILTLSEILDVRAEVDGMAEGWILEASVKVNHGKAATVLVKRGTMRVGDLIVAGTTYARIRMMRNEAGLAVQEAGPGTPVEVLGWRDSPMAGDMVLQAPDEDKAQASVAYRQESADREKAAAQKGEEEVKNREKAEQEALEKMMAEQGEDAVEEAEEVPGTKTVNMIVRGDVMGSVEAVCTAVMEIGNNEVRPRILRSSPGQVAESDIDLAAAAKACIINFNNDVPGFVRRKADDQGVKILDHAIIYALVDDVKLMLSQQLAPITSQRVLAEAEVLQVFSINVVKRKFKNIAGVRVRTGAVTRAGLYRVMRDGEKVYDGKLDALKQGKKEVSEMKKGTECGLSFEDYDDFQPGDIVQLYEEKQEKRYL